MHHYTEVNAGNEAEHGWGFCSASGAYFLNLLKSLQDKVSLLVQNVSNVGTFKIYIESQVLHNKYVPK